MVRNKLMLAHANLNINVFYFSSLLPYLDPTERSAQNENLGRARAGQLNELDKT